MFHFLTSKIDLHEKIDDLSAAYFFCKNWDIIYRFSNTVHYVMSISIIAQVFPVVGNVASFTTWVTTAGNLMGEHQILKSCLCKVQLLLLYLDYNKSHKRFRKPGAAVSLDIR